jgi:hypothetical protein
MVENLAENVSLGDGGNDLQRPPPTRGAAFQVEGEDTLQQSCPVPVRRACLRFLAVYTLLARCGNNRGPELAMRRETPRVAHQVDTRQGHECHKLLQKLQRRKFDLGGTIGPRAVKQIYQVPIVASSVSRSSDMAPLPVYRIKRSN